MDAVGHAVDVVEQELQRRPRWRTAVTLTGWLLVAVYFLFAALVLGLRYWILPNIGQHTELIERTVSRVIGERVTIGEVSAGWEGLRPELDLRDLRIHDSQGRLALSLPTVEAVLSWSSLAYGSVHFHSLAFDRPDLAIRRDESGRLHVAGLELKRDASGSGLSDWLLAQPEVSVRDATVTWADSLRGAPLLALSGVNLMLKNSGEAHRFGLRAAVPRELASALDVRGELRGGSLERLDEWSGQLYAELDHTDLAAWRRWFDYPIEVRSGEGGVRLWLGFANRKVTQVTADVTLARVAARAAPSLPMLELEFLRGRLGITQSPAVTELFAKQVTLRTAGGVALPPAQIALRLEHAHVAGSRPRGEFSADALVLQPLAGLAEFLPFTPEVRKRLAQAELRGSVHDLKANWQGETEHPQAYSLKGRFNSLGMRANAGLPGFSGLSGSIDANDKGGSVTLASEKMGVVAPGFFAEPAMPFDLLAGHIGWTFPAGNVELKVSNLTLANADVAANLSGSFATRRGSPGFIDLNGKISRLDGRLAWRYVPRISGELRDYLKTAIVSGNFRDMQLRIKGDLSQFPFDNPKQGVFQVTGKVIDGELNYAEGWPRLNAIAGDWGFEGGRMLVRAQRASVLGARLSNVRATIPDIFHDSEMLSVEGQAEAASSEFTRFIEASPLTRYLDGATRDIRVSGNGRLALKLDLPIRKPEAFKLSGSVQVQNNQLFFDPELPAITQMSGRLDFTESGIAMRGVSGQFLGGPIAITAQTRPDGVLAISTQGTAAVAALRRLVDQPLLDAVTGAAPWRATILARRRAVDVVLESNLQGVAIDLPLPLGKSAVEVLPLRLERVNSADAEMLRAYPGVRIAARGDAVMVTLGNTPRRNINALILRRFDAGGLAVDRGTVAFNERAVAPTQSGVVLTGSLPYADLDRWQAVLASPAGAASGVANGAGQAPASATTGSLLTGINLKFGMLDIAGKRFNDLALRATVRTGQWSATVDARELKGEVQWRPAGRGRVQARLSHLSVPEDKPATPGTAPEEIAHELPALDVIAENFVMRDRQLGRLELIAVNDARDWRIEKLVLANPEGTLAADGVWQSWAARPSISVNVRIEAGDLGKFLERMGHPKVMQSGTGKLEGKIGWAGSPQSPDFATLTGNLALTAGRGQFLKADPGVAKLLGVLSLQSLVTLDLRDLFREGFSYDTISGTAELAKGVMTTTDFFMKGASAQVKMSGAIDLVHETQNLHMRVVPSLGDGASTVASIVLANPILGLGATLLQRLLKDPLGQIFAVEYDVTGTWNEPKVQRTRVDAPLATGPAKQ